jgi:hypothetical protein
MENDNPSAPELEPREPTVEDLVNLCRELNGRAAKYVVVGGFAMRAAGYIRQTLDIDLIVATDPDNEIRICRALASLPDGAIKELRPGDLDRYSVIRVADELVVDLMKSASGFDYLEAVKDVIVHDLEGVRIPFASPRLLWRMKVVTHREKDAADLLFLRHWFASRNELPPSASSR